MSQHEDEEERREREQLALTSLNLMNTTIMMGAIAGM